MIIHLPFFIISIGTYITVIDRNICKKHPVFFVLYSCVSLFLLVLLILLFVKLYGLIYHLMDDYFIQAKGDNGGNSGGQGPGSGPDSGPGSGPGPDGPSGNNNTDPYVQQSSNDKKQSTNKKELTEEQKIKRREASVRCRAKLKKDTTVDENGLTRLDKNRAKTRKRTAKYRETERAKEVKRVHTILSKPTGYE